MMNFFNYNFFFPPKKNNLLWALPKKSLFVPVYIISVISICLEKYYYVGAFQLSVLLHVVIISFFIALVLLVVNCLIPFLLTLRIKRGVIFINWGFFEEWKCDLSNLNNDLKIKKTLKYTILSFKNNDNERILIVLNPYLIKLIKKNIEKQSSKDSYSRLLSII